MAAAAVGPEAVDMAEVDGPAAAEDAGDGNVEEEEVDMAEAEVGGN